MKEAAREMDTIGWIDTVWRDLRFAVRMLRKNPGFAVTSAITLALGIGASTAIFSVVYGVLLRPLPYPSPGDLMTVSEMIPRIGPGQVSAADYYDWRNQNEVFTGMAHRGTTGIYHFAILLPNRRELARAIARLFALRWPNSPTDHIMTKTTYLDDPEGNNIELYTESPEDGSMGFKDGEPLPAAPTAPPATGASRWIWRPCLAT